MSELETAKHEKYFSLCLNCIPSSQQSLDPNRMTILYFLVAGLDLLGVLDKYINRKDVADWIYAMQVVDEATNRGGFRCGPHLGEPFGCNSPISPFDLPHLTMTHTAISILTILGDDLSRLNKEAIVNELTSLQTDLGSFRCLSGPGGSEHDMRFTYCACMISALINDWRGVDVNRMVSYILKCQTYEGGFSQLPGQEAHGGSTLCAVAALSLSKQMNCISPAHRSKLIHWLLQRQVFGFQGRANKIPDVCYSYWVGGSLKLLDAFDMVDHTLLRQFILSCQSPVGGISKHPDSRPDPLHSYLGLVGLTFLHTRESDRLPVVDPAYGFHLSICPSSAF